MIPVRVSLKNFLCYAEEPNGQLFEFDFEGSSLWSISGDNGAGKSAIFDAITYALFGQHRGGSQEDSRLIRKGADHCEVSFEFRLEDNHVYRVRRTVGRPKGKSRQEAKTRQASRFEPANDAWRPVRETEREEYLKRWVQEKLGFGYDTFVASVMLRQGESDQLITAQASRRFQILSGLLDLEPYKQLEVAANNKRRDTQVQADALDKRLATLPVVSAEDLGRAEQEVHTNEQLLEQGRHAIAGAEVVVSEARRYAGSQRELAEARAALANIEHLRRDADRIRDDYQEWRRLSTALPPLRSAVADLQQATQLTEQAQQKEVEAVAIELDTLEHLAAAAAAEEQKIEAHLKTLRQRHDVLDEELPLVNEVFRCRRELALREHTRAERGGLEIWKTRVADQEAALRRQHERKQSADGLLQHATEQVALATAALRQARQQLTLRQEARDEAACSRCGQPVDPEHIRRELMEVTQSVATAQQMLETATQHQREVARQAREVATLVEETGRQLPHLHQSLATAQSAEKEWDQARDRLQHAMHATESASCTLVASVTERPMDEAEVLLRTLNAELKTLKGEIKQAEEAGKRAGGRTRNAQQEWEKARRERERLRNEVTQFAERASALRNQAEVRLDGIEPTWRDQALRQDIPALKTLAQRHVQLQGIEQQHAELEKAGEEYRRLEVRIEEIQKRHDSVRPEHRIPEQEAVRASEEAKNRVKELQKRRDDSVHALRGLQEKQKERQRITEEASGVVRQHRLYKRLVELFGRNGLQSFLLNEAIQGIAHLANETLARLSGGQLRLSIEREEEEIAIRAIDLAFSEEPLDVRFLSGSQKFRVSVALAAGIGQYAGRGVGSVRSLIIDEGFGSLDTQGRQEMIDELRNLSQLMDRLIIVSHQEDFQDRTLFPTGYVLRKINQRTQVERFV
ncbi:MAG: SMC family ATPase [Deltaproteobacteria bacterium]|nr:SMC family ATPase [Deltaproteobacteria bacterium]